MIDIVETASGRTYGIGVFSPGSRQYMDREYLFSYIPEELLGLPLVMTCGKDKMISEDNWCFSIRTEYPCEVFVIFADKHPYLPVWLETYQRLRMNVTREDSHPKTLKGYFSVYKKCFPAGEIRFNGNSSNKLLERKSYIETRGTDYCMYSIVIREMR